MLSHLQPTPKQGAHVASLHDRLNKLLTSARAGDPLDASMREISESLGFESFMYGMCTSDARPHHDSRAYVWTTLPKEWVALYDRMSYVEVDPRLTHTWNRTAPYIWDAATITGEWQVQRFLNDAASFGIRSGVVVSFRDERHARIIVALNSSISPVTAERYAVVKSRLGDIMMLATCFHDIFMANCFEQGVAPRQRGGPLSPRERQCLEMAARGLTSADIGLKLGIAERTANFHFSNLISKLGVINRHEAIARGISTGMISTHTGG